MVSEFYRSSIFKHSSGLKEVNFCDFQFAAENPNDSENSWIFSEFSMLVFLCLVLLTNITLFICLLYLFSIFVYSIFVSYQSYSTWYLFYSLDLWLGNAILRYYPGTLLSSTHKAPHVFYSRYPNQWQSLPLDSHIWKVLLYVAEYAFFFIAFLKQHTPLISDEIKMP